MAVSVVTELACIIVFVRNDARWLEMRASRARGWEMRGGIFRLRSAVRTRAVDRQKRKKASFEVVTQRADAVLVDLRLT